MKNLNNILLPLSFFLLTCAPPAPRIDYLDPEAADPGDTLVIHGSGFGTERGESYVTIGGVQPTGSSYYAWSDTEIRLRVPESGESAMVYVYKGKTRSPGALFAAASSLPVLVTENETRPAREAADGEETEEAGPQTMADFTGKNGARKLGERLNYTLSYSVDVRVQEASLPNTLYLWVPRPVDTASQRLREAVTRSAEPFLDNYNGASLYRYSALAPGSAAAASVTYLVETAAIEVTASAAAKALFTKARAAFDRARKEAAVVGTGGGATAGAGGGAAAGGAGGGAGVSAGAGGAGAANTANSGGKTVDPWDAADRFCALCSEVNITSRKQTGILIGDDLVTKPHCWAEFWVDDLGWVPVDLSEGLFASLDNRRASFSIGESVFPEMDAKSRKISRERTYALQNTWEEAVGGLNSWSSFWSDVVVTGVYAH